MQVNIDEARVCSLKELEKGRAMTAHKAAVGNHMCTRRFVIYVCMYEHMLVYMWV